MNSRGDAPIRVLVVADKLGFPGVRLHGMGRAIVEWSRAFDPARVRLRTCVLRDIGGYRAEVAASNAPIEFLDLSPFSPATPARLASLVREYRADVLHLNGIGAATFGRLAGIMTRCPAIVHVHSNSNYDPKGYPRYVRVIDNLLARSTARAIAISESVRDFCVHEMGFRAGQVELVHNGTPRLDYDAVPPERIEALRRKYGIGPGPVVGICSRLYAIKGHSVLLNAFARMLPTCPRAHLLVVGDGPERSALETQARSAGIASSVSFAGFQEDVAAHLRLLDVAVVPSIHPEPFGLVAVEALAAGVPVIASRVGGLAEIISEGVAGLLVEPGDVDGLAAALALVLGDEELRRRLASAAVGESRRFSMDRFVERMEQVYRAVKGPR